VDIPGGSVDVQLTPEQLTERRAAWSPRPAKITTGWVARYARMVTSANRGAVLE